MSLSKIFSFAAKATLGIAAFAVTGYVGSTVFDPAFWGIFHNSNIMGDALKLMAAEKFAWIHDAVGLTGTGGLLNAEWVQDLIGLKPYLARVTPAALATNAGSLENVLELGL